MTKFFQLIESISPFRWWFCITTATVHAAASLLLLFLNSTVFFQEDFCLPVKQFRLKPSHLVLVFSIHLEKFSEQEFFKKTLSAIRDWRKDYKNNWYSI